MTYDAEIENNICIPLFNPHLVLQKFSTLKPIKTIQQTWRQYRSEFSKFVSDFFQKIKKKHFTTIKEMTVYLLCRHTFIFEKVWSFSRVF